MFCNVYYITCIRGRLYRKLFETLKMNIIITCPQIWKFKIKYSNFVPVNAIKVLTTSNILKVFKVVLEIIDVLLQKLWKIV